MMQQFPRAGCPPLQGGQKPCICLVWYQMCGNLQGVNAFLAEPAVIVPTC